MTPISIQIVHEFQNHEHSICKAIGEQHIHQLDNDCDEYHKQLTSFSIDFTSNFDVIPTHFYTTIYIDKPQTIKEVYRSKKSSRAPPYFTI